MSAVRDSAGTVERPCVHIEYVLHGALAEAVRGVGRIERIELERDVTGETVGDALRSLTDEFPALGPLVSNSKGALRAHVSLRRNGEDVRDGAWLATPIADDDTLTLEPGLKGGC